MYIYISVDLTTWQQRRCKNDERDG